MSVRPTDAYDRRWSQFVTDLRARIDHNGGEVLEEQVDISTATSGPTQCLKKKGGDYTTHIIKVAIFERYFDIPGRAVARRRCFYPRRHSTGNDGTLRMGAACH